MKSVYHCKECHTFSEVFHFHCKECSILTTKLPDAKYHHALHHKKWWLEKPCGWGQDCLVSGCHYTHYHYNKRFIIERIDMIPDSICVYDLPWINIRCQDPYCAKDHFIGRI